jgi:hypothetical protein
MNKEQVCKLLRGFDSDGIICYAYRETAFALLADGKCDGTLHLITDAPAGNVSDVLTKNDCRDITQLGDVIDAKLAQQSVKVKLIDGDMDKLTKTICRPLTVCSLMLRANGDVYDEFGGMDDLNAKILRKTDAPIRDKNYFCTFCFDLTLKRGFVPDASIRDEMKRMVTLPLSKKIQLLLTVRSVLKSKQFKIEYVLNALTYDGLFPNSGDVSDCKKDSLERLLKSADADKITLLLCYLAGIRGDQLKSVPSFGYEKVFYENVCRFIKENKSVGDTEVIKHFTGKNGEAAGFIAEALSLLAGTEPCTKKQTSDLLRNLNKSEYWKHEDPTVGQLEIEPERDCSDDETIAAQQDDIENMEDLLGGLEDDGYEVEYTENPISIPENSRFGLRNPADNHYIKK